VMCDWLLVKVISLGLVLWVISDLPCASVSKQALVPNLSYENDFDLD